MANAIERRQNIRHQHKRDYDQEQGSKYAQINRLWLEAKGALRIEPPDEPPISLTVPPFFKLF